MLNKWRTLFAGLLLVSSISASFAGSGEIELKIGNVTVPPSSLASGGCIQVPILINDPSLNNRDLRDITFTVTVEDPSNVISGGIAANMIVANGFAPTGSGTGVTGITNPGTNLSNSNGTSTPACTSVFNQATQGTGAAIDFAANVNAQASWSINNNQGGVARKQAFLIDLTNNFSLGGIPQNTDTLIAVLEIPIISNPGQAQITLTATPVATVAGGNTYTYDTGVRDSEGNRVQMVEDFTLPASASTVNIFDPVNCSGATTTPTNPTWADPQDGGIGGALTFTFPGTALADQVHLTSSDGLDVTIPSGGATTTYSIDTTNDGSPTAGANRTYTAAYQVEFPPASGTYVDGTPCNLSPSFAAGSATMAWTVVPVINQATTMDIVLTNAQYTGGKYATLTGPNGVNVDLTAPTSGAGSNVLSFDDALSIATVTNANVGTYTVAGVNAAGTAFTQTLVLTLEPPVNQTVCANITAADIEGMVTIPLAGNDGTVDFDIVYNGTTYENVGEGNFDLTNIVGDVTSVTIKANGFDSGGNPISDDIICDINYNLPTCAASQDPAGTVDVGTVINLFLDTTNAVAATLEGVAMTPDVDPDTNFNVQWTASHVAIADRTLTATVTNADGETSTCTFTIDINCIDPEIVSVAPVGQTGITIYGTFGCDYTVRVTQHNTGVSNDYTVTIDNLTNVGLNVGTGTLNIVVPSDSWIEIGQLGLPTVTSMVTTVPTLGEWALIAFMLLLMGTGMVFLRNRKIA